MRLKASFHNMTGGVIRMGVQVLTVPVLIRLIGLEEYGLWVLVSAMVGVVFLVEGGLSTTTTVYLSRDLTEKNSSAVAETLTVVFGSMLCLATLAAAVLGLGADFANRFFDKLQPAQIEAAIRALQLSAVVIWARLLQQVFVGVEQAFQRFGWMNVVTTLQQVLINLGMLAIAALGGRIVAFMKWQALVGLTTLCIHVILALWLLRHESLRPRWNPAKSREIARFSLLTWFSNLGSVLFTQCDRLVIGRLLGAESLGIYGAVTTVTIQLNALSNLPSQPLVPFISQIKTRREFQNDTVRRQVQHSFEMNVLVALGLGIALFVMASLILKIFFPPLLEKNYLAIFQIAVVITAVYSVNTTGYYLMLGVRAVKECMWIQIVTAVVTLALIFLGAWWGGLLGAVVGSLGYQATWLYTILGMKKIELPARAWLGWIGPYAMSFGAVILLSLVLPPNLMLKTALTIAALLSLGGVFLWRHRKQFLRSFKLPTYINSWRSW